MEEKIIRDLAAMLLVLAGRYEIDCGPEEPVEKVREYLSSFPVGQDVLRQYDDNNLRCLLDPEY